MKKIVMECLNCKKEMVTKYDGKRCCFCNGPLGAIREFDAKKDLSLINLEKINCKTK